MNQLDVSLQHSIATLAAKGWSSRKIARELDVDRETVRRYRAAPDPKPAIVPTGCLRTATRPGRTSQCAPLSSIIEAALLAGLSAQRIYQDLVRDHQFTGGYDAVKRFVRGLAQRTEPPFRRMEYAPGQELQVDFGLGAWVMEAGKRRRPHLFRAVLAHSRKAYSEVVWRQTSESFLRCLENAFRHFGGVTATVVIAQMARASPQSPKQLRAAVAGCDANGYAFAMKLQEIEREAMGLSESERAELVLALLNTLPAPGADIADEEVFRRDAELESGSVEPMMHEEFIRRVRDERGR